MDTKQKMAIVGSSLMVTGVGLGLVGAALLVTAAFEWTARLVEKGADGFTAKVERASKTVGVVAGSAAWATRYPPLSEATSALQFALPLLGFRARLNGSPKAYPPENRGWRPCAAYTSEPGHLVPTRCRGFPPNP